MNDLFGIHEVLIWLVLMFVDTAFVTRGLVVVPHPMKRSKACFYFQLEFSPAIYLFITPRGIAFIDCMASLNDDM